MNFRLVKDVNVKNETIGVLKGQRGGLCHVREKPCIYDVKAARIHARKGWQVCVIRIVTVLNSQDYK